MMQKIHRRRTEEINKQFICPSGCGKAYGSYAALYTHIKNKHPQTKPPQMKEDTIKSAKQEHSRKHKPERSNNSGDSPIVEYDCKVCRQAHCICYEEIDQVQMDKAIQLFEDQAFIKFVDAVGKLNNGQKFTWTRGTEDGFTFLPKQHIRHMATLFNQKYHSFSPVVLSGRLLQFLSMSSRFWDSRVITELYQVIFTILSRTYQKQVQMFMNNKSQFQSMNQCIEARPKQWNEFVTMIRFL